MLKSGERIDDLQRNGLKIIQDPGRFCFGMDAVLLSGFASAGIRQGMRVLDLGTGTGIIPLLLSAKTQAESLCGLEIQADSADMARRSVAMNHLEDRISVIQGDIKEADKLFAAASFDVVTSNPPYMIGQHGLTNPEAPKAIARHEVLCTFEDIAAQTARLLAPGGSFYLVHSAGGDHDHAGKIQAGAEADAAGVSLCRPRAEHGAAAGGARRETADDGREAAGDL